MWNTLWTYKSERSVVMLTLGWNKAEGRCQCSSARNCELSLASRFVEKKEAGKSLPHAAEGREGFLRSHAPPPLSVTWMDLPLKLLQRERPCLWSCVPFVRKTSKEVGINSHLAVVLNLLPWVWCELGSCPAHRHLWSIWVSEQREWSEVAPSTSVYLTNLCQEGFAIF